MPYDDPDPTDPTMLIGVEAPAGETSDIEMAYAFAEEFAQLGYSAERLMGLFRNPFYAGAHRALQVLGEENIQSIVQEAVDVWGSFRVVFSDGEEDGVGGPAGSDEVAKRRTEGPTLIDGGPER